MNNSSRPRLLFLSLARDCEKTLPYFDRYLEDLRRSGIECRAMIGENGSSDATRALIEDLREKDVELVDTSSMSQGQGRLSRMALGREILLKALDKTEGNESTYVCVMDLDDIVLSPPKPAAVLAATAILENNKDVFAIGAASTPVYYDLLSLRADGHDYSTLFTEIGEAKKRPLTYYRFHQRRIYANQRRATASLPTCCTSSFNGFCLYKLQTYKLGTYLSGDMDSTCEHVNFNLSIGRVNSQKMLIMPELTLSAPRDHIEVGFVRFWLDRVRKSR